MDARANKKAARQQLSTRRDPERTRAAILAAATAEFCRKGLDGARIDQITRRSGVNKRMIYHYFGNKEGLYLAVLERVYEDLRGTERRLNLDHLEPEVAIQRLVEFNFDYSRQHPEMISLINSENLHRARHLSRSRKVRELHSPFVKLIGDILRRGVAKGVFRPGLDPVDAEPGAAERVADRRRIVAGAQELPRAKPAEVGLSAERLERIEARPQPAAAAPPPAAPATAPE